MNDLLRDTLTAQADSVEPPPLDLTAIIAAGNHRRSRRRLLTVASGTAVALAGGGLAIAAGRKHRVPSLPFTERRVTYAVGSDLHYGNETISVAPHRITAFVQTDAGFVFLNQENEIHLADHTGVRGLGKGTWRLTADVRGNLVAWVEGFNDHFESVVYDVNAQRELVRTSAGNRIPPNVSLVADPRVVALDGNLAYFGAYDGFYRWDVITNKGERIAKVPLGAVRAVAAGQIVFQQPLTQRPPAVGLAIARTVSTAAPAKFTGQQAFLSPSAKYLVTEPTDALPVIEPGWADLALYEVASARKVGLPYAYDHVYFGQWLGDEKFVAAGKRRFSKSAETDLLVVTAASGAVRVAVPAFSTLRFSTTPPRNAPFALPTGSAITDLY
ncbi:hypothetical protein GCM10009630_33840 [Kribbella jejuensis]|uniref:Uncharacterized protein n=1 Tax=Kribbella jejuensis TaxID=236068 RepID=A0A542DT57_9ACTN|nr:hypothetical protein [Kribbella jejuensis]TQJ06277.1 hypothetical protein FB475_5934 [Kribbella jejuensis]